MTAPTPVVDRRPADGIEVDLSISIDAPIEIVFDFLTVPELAFRWMGIEGEIDARPGGSYRVRYTEDDVAAGEYVEVTKPTTVAWTWGWEGSDTIPPGSSLVTFSLADAEGSTIVTVRHTGLPTAPDAEQHTAGWSYWGRRLARAATGGDPDSIPFEDGADDE